MLRFTEGDIVRHRRYGYRAVVLSADLRCMATEKWYRRNVTRPAREQPWYRVLDEEGCERYVAEENLLADHSGEEVGHPIIQLVFPTFVEGKYYRQSLN